MVNIWKAWVSSQLRGLILWTISFLLPTCAPFHYFLTTPNCAGQNPTQFFSMNIIKAWAIQYQEATPREYKSVKSEYEDLEDSLTGELGEQLFIWLRLSLEDATGRIQRGAMREHFIIPHSPLRPGQNRRVANWRFQYVDLNLEEC